MNIFLFIVYFFLFGITKLLIKIFQPYLINIYKKETPSWKNPKVDDYNVKGYVNPW